MRNRNNLEREFKIPIRGTKLNIYAKQYGSFDKPVVIFVHGLTGHMDEHLFYNGARYFHRKGISSLRFNLYDWRKDARKLTHCTLKTHAHDVNMVIDYLRTRKVSRVFAIGHSYGGPTILLARRNLLDGIVLWDPSYETFRLFKDAKYIEKFDAYCIRWGSDVLIGSGMFQEASKLDWRNLATSMTTPLKIIAAGKYRKLVKGSRRYIEGARGPKELTVIKNAGHNFNEEGVAERLFDESVNWLKSYTG